ncbi:PepSY-associated TM helix domain-containing protein [Brevundimonas sp.]
MSEPENSTSNTPLSGAYRAVWRWHFYAGFLVLPFLMLMALTGGLYLFKAEIDDAVYRPMATVEARGNPASPDRWVAAARVGTGGEVTNVLVPDRPDRAVQMVVRLPGDSRRIAFVDPYSAELKGVTAYVGLTETIKRIHSLEQFGPVMNLVVEIVAGWAIILFATGLFLWWPRKRAVGVTTLKTTDPKRRPFWRDLHALTGLYAGGIILFLAVTGMPWSSVWGGQVLKAMNEAGLGRPKAPSSASSWTHAEHDDKPKGAGWALEHSGLPTPHHPAGPRLSAVIARAEATNLPRPYTISIPATPDRAVSVARQSTRVQDSRTLYVDGATGALVADIRYSQYGWGARAFEWGIFTHQGTQYGQINRIIMLLGCIAIWVLAISGLVMWWKRRPARRGLSLGAPPAPPGLRVRAAVLGIVIPLSLLYPLTGLSLLAALAIDRLVARVVRPRPVAS